MPVLTLALIVACIVILVRAVVAINQMTRRTSILVAAPYIGLAVGALATALAPFYGLPVSAADVLLAASIALLLLTCRRLPARHRNRGRLGR